MSRYLKTLIETSKRSTEKEKKLKVITYNLDLKVKTKNSFILSNTKKLDRVPITN